MSLKTINEKIAKAGYPEVEVERGCGYIYFIFDDTVNYETESVMVPYLNMYSEKEWIKDAMIFGDKIRSKIKDRAEHSYTGGPFAILGHRHD